MVSSLTERGSEITLRALELGAVDFVTKPKVGIRDGMLDYAEKLADKIRAASRARVQQPRARAHARAGAPARREAAPLFSNPLRQYREADHRRRVDRRHRGDPRSAGAAAARRARRVLIAQHMPAGFTRSFAQRLNGLCRITVKEAEHGERVLPGHAYIAPGHATWCSRAAARTTSRICRRSRR